MKLLIDILTEITKNPQVIHNTTGEGFEENFKNLLLKKNFKEQTFETLSKNKQDKLKEIVIDKSRTTTIELNNFKELINNEYTFIYQPFGSQNYPDFLILYKDKAIPIETKFAKNGPPM